MPYRHCQVAKFQIDIANLLEGELGNVETNLDFSGYNSIVAVR
jgi:hypothetical protein